MRSITKWPLLTGVNKMPNTNKAEYYCEELDASVYSGDAFSSYEAALVLKRYAERWLRHAENVIKQGPDLDDSEE